MSRCASKLKSRLPRYAADVSVAFAQYRRIRAMPRSGAVGMLYLPRVHRLADGRTQDFIFGDLLAGEGLAKPMPCARTSLAIRGRPRSARMARRSICIPIIRPPSRLRSC